MERWTDQQLLVYIQLALGYINAAPLQTGYNIYEMPEAWETPVVIGAVIFALFGIFSPREKLIISRII